MKKSDRESLIKGLEDALAWARGEPNGCIVHTPEQILARRATRREGVRD